MFFNRIALAAFVKHHAPSKPRVAADAALVEAYAGKLPACLIELWRKHGLGRYGAWDFQLLDPREWQATLNRWIVSPPDETLRIPIACTPFGRLVYYRKLTTSDEDVALLDPQTRSNEVLAWSLENFFNDVLCSDDGMESLTSAAELDAARQQHGPLSLNEVYEVDPAMLPVGIFVTRKVAALDMHRRWRDAVDGAQQAEALKTKPLAKRIPNAWRALFADASRELDVRREGPVGLWVSEYLDWYRLLLLRPAAAGKAPAQAPTHGTYELLFWHDDPRSARPEAPRHYTGAWRASTTDGGDTLLNLAMTPQDPAPSSDHNEEALVLLNTPSHRMLFWEHACEDIAQSIHWKSQITDVQALWFEAELSQPVPNRIEGVPSPRWAELPDCVQRRTLRQPLTLDIVEVIHQAQDGDDEWLVRLNGGSRLALTMNMPLCSPMADPKGLLGWVGDVAEESCEFRVRVQTDDEGNVINAPSVGDTLSTRDPEAGPIE